MKSASHQYSAVLSCSVMSHSLQPYGLQPVRLLCPQGFSRREYWRGLPCPVFLQGIFQTQVLNPGLPHCRRILYHLSHQVNLVQSRYLRPQDQRMATHSSILAWKIPWTEELQSMGSQSQTRLSDFNFTFKYLEFVELRSQQTKFIYTIEGNVHTYVN